MEETGAEGGPAVLRRDGHHGELGMASGTAARTVRRVRGLTASVAPRPRGGTRHPLVAAAMAVPVALLLVACGGWHAIAEQASSVAGLMGR